MARRRGDGGMRPSLMRNRDGRAQLTSPVSVVAAGFAVTLGLLAAGCSASAPDAHVPSGRDELAVIKSSLDEGRQDARAEELCHEWSTGFGATQGPQLKILAALDSTPEVADSIAQASGYPATFAGTDTAGTYAAICVVQDDTGQFGHVATAVLEDSQASYIAAWE
jgi:hypothetical protein